MIPAIVLVTLLAAAQVSRPAMPAAMHPARFCPMSTVSERPEVQIDAVHVAWADATRRGDVDGMLALLTADYVLWAPGVAPVEGRESVRRVLAAAVAAYEIETILQTVERVIVGDVAWERGIETQHVRPRGGGESIERRQRLFLVLRREADGCWRYARGMSNVGPDA
ncbi:MAG: DUF4440 domain-containing protein [Acidobacteria bacterium]|nr:DUF4440 domain-containing protein [Acidobacteriota bacterium]